MSKHQREFISSAAAQQTEVSAKPTQSATEQAPAGLAGQAVGMGSALLQMQRTLGNRHVQGVIDAQAASAPAPIIQTKLVLGPTDDPYEREADRMAQQVVGQDAQSGIAATPLTSSAVRRIATHPGSGGAVDASVQQGIQRVRGGGHSLPDTVRSSMEQSLGADFSGVRVHTGARADQLNQSLQARAFTTGQDIFFRRGEYNPSGQSGQQILAHELTHVVQQGKGIQNDELSTEQGRYIQRKPYLGMGNTWYDDNFPGYSLSRWTTPNGDYQYQIDGTNIAFYYQEGSYYQNNQEVQPATLLALLKEQRTDESFIESDSSDSEDTDFDFKTSTASDIVVEQQRRKPMYRFGASNLEKFGKSTKSYYKHEKRAMITNTIDMYQPTAFGMEEVTDPEHFFAGSDRIPGVMQRPINYYNEAGEEELKRQRQFSRTKREGALNTTLEHSYDVDRGVQFTAGNYKENYALLTKGAEILETSAPIAIDLATGTKTEGNEAFTFSKKDKVNRRLVMWKLTLNASPYTLRPTPFRDIPRAQVYLGVVHTSPSIDIKSEIEGILHRAQVESNESGIPVILIGDFYMQNSAPQIWEKLKAGQYENWKLVYPENVTNFPHSGEGQIADHAVVDAKAFKELGTQAILRPTSEHEALGNQPFVPDQKKLSESYTDIGVDHAQIMTLLEIDPRTYPKMLQPPTKRTLYKIERTTGKHKRSNPKVDPPLGFQVSKVQKPKRKQAPGKTRKKPVRKSNT